MKLFITIKRTLSAYKKKYIPLFVYFGTKVVVPLLINDIRTHWPQKNKWYIYARKHELIEKYLYIEFSHIIDIYRQEKIDSIEDGRYLPIIWICWWQGYDNMPPIVKKCYESVKMHSGKYKIQLITEENHIEFVNIPDAIVNKYKLGKLKVQFVTDTLRCCLLAKYGGIWIDATLYLTKDISEQYLKIPVFSLKTAPVDNKSVSEYRWSSFLLATNLKTDFFACLRDLMIEYGCKKAIAIDYLLIDYFIDIMIKHIPRYANYMANIPFSNPHLHQLRLNFNEIFDETVFEDFKSDTFLFKLTYKGQLSTHKNGMSTFYNFILNR
jgi:hypothetical protein